MKIQHNLSKCVTLQEDMFHEINER